MFTPRTLLVALALLTALAAASPVQAQADPKVVEVLKKFESEPSIRDVQEAVLRYALISNDRMEGWITRARLAHIIPSEIGGSYQIDTNDDNITQSREDLVREIEGDFNSQFVIADQQNVSRVDDDESERIRLDADWDLNKLIFNSDELRVASETARQVRIREQLLNTVTKLYFERRRLQVDMLLKPKSDPSAAIRAQLRIDELTADIDALTGGWFSKQLR